MKKLLTIGLCLIFSANMHALSFTSKPSVKIGQMCGNDGCSCDDKMLGLKEKPEAN